jgi:hypothetical protein
MKGQGGGEAQGVADPKKQGANQRPTYTKHDFLVGQRRTTELELGSML